MEVFCKLYSIIQIQNLFWIHTGHYDECILHCMLVRAQYWLSVSDFPKCDVTKVSSLFNFGSSIIDYNLSAMWFW